MTLIQINRIKIEGSGNSAVQNSEKSTININSENSEQVTNFIKEFNSSSLMPINIIILTSTRRQMETLNLSTDLINIEKYGYEVLEWKPFGEETILAILKEIIKHIRGEINVFTFNEINIDDDYVLAYLKYIKLRTILIVDIFTLHFQNYKFIANMFNDYHIGGCIVISPENVNIELQNLKRAVFNHLEIYLDDFAGKIGLMHIRVEDITKKRKLIAEITNIAEYFLNSGMKKIISEKRLEPYFSHSVMNSL
jgi:hypothetical protein